METKNSKRIVLISCTKKKEQGIMEARELYSKSPHFKKSLEYAEKLKDIDAIYILSANPKYGLLELDDEIEPYNITLAYVSPEEREKMTDLHVLQKEEKEDWGKKVAKQLGEKRIDLQNDTFIMLAGQNYLKPLKKYLGKCNVVEPLKGLRQGERLQKLKLLIEGLCDEKAP